MFIRKLTLSKSIGHVELSRALDGYEKHLTATSLYYNPINSIYVCRDFVFFCKESNIKKINDNIILGYIGSKLLNKQWKRVTANKRFVELRGFLNFVGYRYNGPNIKFTMNKRPNPGIDGKFYLNFCQFYSESCPHNFATRFIASTAVRSNEFLKIRKKDFASDLSFVCVRGKAGNDRSISVPTFIRQYLGRYLSSLGGDNFPIYNYSRQTLRNKCREITMQYFGKSLSPQDLRVLCLQTVKNYFDDDTACSQAGHANISTTKKYYLHQNPNKNWSSVLEEKLMDTS